MIYRIDGPLEIDTILINSPDKEYAVAVASEQLIASLVGELRKRITMDGSDPDTMNWWLSTMTDKWDVMFTITAIPKEEDITDSIHQEILAQAHSFKPV